VGLGIVLGIILMAIFAPHVAPYPEDVDSVHFERTFQPPGREFLFGTDEVGRDVLSRVIFGTRISLSLGVTVLAIALTIGVPLGLIAGYVGGPVNTFIMRLTDIFLAIPGEQHHRHLLRLVALVHAPYSRPGTVHQRGDLC